MINVNIWTRDKLVNGTGATIIVTQRIRVQGKEASQIKDKEYLLTYPDCLDALSNDDLAEVIDDIMIKVARETLEGEKLEPTSATQPRRRVFGVLVHDPGWWQRMRLRLMR